MPNSGAILLREYDSQVTPTDRLPRHDLVPVLFGLYGEVGSILAVAKKRYREKELYIDHEEVVQEEFGDTLWYTAALCRRLRVRIDKVFGESVGRLARYEAIAATDLEDGPLARVSLLVGDVQLQSTLLQLAQSASALLTLHRSSAGAKAKLRKFAERYLAALNARGIPFARVVHANIAKVRGRFLPPERRTLPKFDEEFERDEQIPSEFEIHIVQRAGARCLLQWNGVFIGDPLTDNIADRDGYRFHDVFHFAHAAVLHWSPVFRALIKQKRKSDPNVDEQQDGGRAIVIEEGLTAWVFSRAKRQGLFKDQMSLPFDLLKTVQQFVAGYEVERCPLSQWEDAILQGYSVFRRVRENNGGIVRGNRLARTLTYRRR